MEYLNLSTLSQAGGWLYLILFSGMFVEGNLTVILAAFLISQGLVFWPLAIFTILTGGFLEELAWYWLGTHLRKSSRISKWVDRLTSAFDSHFHNRLFRVLLLSKFIYGLHRAVMARSGMLHIEVWSYAKKAFWVVVVWLLIVGALGIIFATSYQKLKGYVRYAEFIVLGIITSFFIVEYFLSKRLKKNM